MRVGYLLVEKKAQALGLLDLVKKRLKSRDIEVVKINDAIPLEVQGSFDMIIHKLSDYQRDADKGDEIAIKIIKQMRDYEQKHKNTCVFIDSIEMVFQLANRAQMSTICEKASFEKNGYTVYVPTWVQIDSKDDISKIKAEIESNVLTYPILCKALNAAEGEGAHDMQLIFNEDQLVNDLKVIPCIAQQFINHDMKMCKIFLVGSSWCIVNRPSIRNFKDKSLSSTSSIYQNNLIKSSSNIHQNNLNESSTSIHHQNNLIKSSTNLNQNHLNESLSNKMDIRKENFETIITSPSTSFDTSTNSSANTSGCCNETIHTKCKLESILFNSHTVSKPDSSSYLNKYAKRYQQYISYGNNELLNDDIVDEIIKRLRMVIPFTLMGIDVIVHGKNYGLIDINFLPGYDGMNNFYDEFFNLILSNLNVQESEALNRSKLLRIEQNGVNSSLSSFSNAI